MKGGCFLQREQYWTSLLTYLRTPVHPSSIVKVYIYHLREPEKGGNSVRLKSRMKMMLRKVLSLRLDMLGTWRRRIISPPRPRVSPLARICPHHLRPSLSSCVLQPTSPPPTTHLCLPSRPAPSGLPCPTPATASRGRVWSSAECGRWCLTMWTLMYNILRFIGPSLSLLTVTLSAFLRWWW